MAPSLPCLKRLKSASPWSVRRNIEKKEGMKSLAPPRVKHTRIETATSPGNSIVVSSDPKTSKCASRVLESGWFGHRSDLPSTTASEIIKSVLPLGMKPLDQGIQSQAKGIHSEFFPDKANPHLWRKVERARGIVTEEKIKTIKRHQVHRSLPLLRHQDPPQTPDYCISIMEEGEVLLISARLPTVGKCVLTEIKATNPTVPEESH
ncbi:hypothetical protein POM88_030920 [Heracleum sosnowskyi]|uniref:Uncharacterized protein n=1 Tax=Heracleum sosnowskyi TaxID=360622 RepID=A0AAD8HYC9_9APIA|nr:hypothetical protein POM88_030920 [Heracleum sosnowskyi]